MAVSHVTWIDGAYVYRSLLSIDPNKFVERELSMPLDSGLKYDLVQCLEAAEDLHSSGGANLVSSLTNHSRTVLFSAAPKGQGRDGHVNEQSYEYWRALFAKPSYIVSDFLLTLVLNVGEEALWYRYNTVLYVNCVLRQPVSESLESKAVKPGIAIPGLSPLRYRTRKVFIGILPVLMMNWIAQLTEGLVVVPNQKFEEGFEKCRPLH